MKRKGERRNKEGKEGALFRRDKVGGKTQTTIMSFVYIICTFRKYALPSTMPEFPIRKGKWVE